MRPCFQWLAAAVAFALISSSIAAQAPASFSPLDMRVPVSPRDGRVLEELPAARLEAGRASIALPDPGRGSGLYVKLFFKEADAAREVRLLPAAREELWLA